MRALGQESTTPMGRRVTRRSITHLDRALERQADAILCEVVDPRVGDVVCEVGDWVLPCSDVLRREAQERQLRQGAESRVSVGRLRGMMCKVLQG